MAKVNGIGGFFFRSGDPASLRKWYSTHLGLPMAAEGHAIFPWRDADDPAREGMTVWATFPKDTEPLGPTRPEFMVNYLVDDHRLGRFGWATDPEGNRLEFWEPKE